MFSLLKAAGRVVSGAVVRVGDNQPKNIGLITNQPLGKLLVVRR
jgi:hypothetical protein